MLGAFVARRRRHLGWTQQEMAAASKGRLTQTYISKLEGEGISVPTRGMMEALADTLDVPIADLYREAGVLEGVESGNGASTPPDAPPVRPDRDYTPEEIAEIVRWVKSLPGAAYRAIIAEDEAELPPEEFVETCLDYHAAWMSNMRLGHNQRRRGRRSGMRNGARA